MSERGRTIVIMHSAKQPKLAHRRRRTGSRYVLHQSEAYGMPGVDPDTMVTEQETSLGQGTATRDSLTGPLQSSTPLARPTWWPWR